MFGTNPFGQSSTSPFGHQPVFGQTNNVSSNPFAPKPFGSTSPFGAQTGGSIFGGMSTGMFGAQSSSPLGSSSLFGASSSPSFGSSTPTFGASTGSAFGNSSSAFGGSSAFGQRPTFGGFGSNSTQSSPFGSSFQQSQPALGSNLFGSSTPFSTPSQPSFGASSSPAFGTPSTPAFGSTATPAFGSTSGGFGFSGSPFGSSSPAFGASSTPAFGASTPAFGASSTPAFGASTPAFGASSTPAFGASNTPAFGATAAPAFGATNTPAFGASSAPAFGASSAPAFGASPAPTFGASSTPSFNFGSSSAFGQSASAFGSSPFGTSSFGAQSTSFGTQTTSPAFGSSAFGQSAFGSRGGTRVSPYSATPETDGATGSQPPGKLVSISAMPVYKDKSHEELRWEDYQLGDKGGPAPAGQAAAASGFGSTGFGTIATPAFGQSAANPFSSSTPSNPFGQNTPGSSSPFGTTPTSAFGSSPFGQSNTSNPFGSSSSSSTSNLFGSTQAFGVNSTTFSSSAFGTPSIFGTTSAQGTSSTFSGGLNFGNTQSSPLFQSTTLAQSSSPFGQTSSAFGQSNLFSTPATGFGGSLFSNTSSLLSNSNTLGFGQTTSSLSTPFQSAQTALNSGGFNFNNFGQSQPAGTGGFGGTSGIFNNNAFGQTSGPQSAAVAQAAPVSVTNPFGTLPAMPQMLIGGSGTSSSIQYGISSMPVVDKSVPMRISSLLTTRHLSQRRIKLPIRKYLPKTDSSKALFFNDDETPSTPKADAMFVPRENPRALVVRPLTKRWHSRSSADKTKATSSPISQNEDPTENGVAKEHDSPPKVEEKANKTIEKGDPFTTHAGPRAGEVAVICEQGPGVEAIMPKLCHSDYFTEPKIQELAAKERAEPGFCLHVKDFVVGRLGYGSIKFFGETDVRRLDLESLVQFNNREVIVYMDEIKKPPVGQGLNKPAEVTLLNIKCYDKKSRQQYTSGPRIDKYKEMLKRKTEDQGAEFVSYDAVKGEWKFRVNHFSKYKLGEEEEDEHFPGLFV